MTDGQSFENENGTQTSFFPSQFLQVSATSTVSTMPFFKEYKQFEKSGLNKFRFILNNMFNEVEF